MDSPLAAQPQKILTIPRQPKNPAAVALGKLGGKKGGYARAAALTPEAKKSIARRAAQARWAKEKVEN